MPTWSGCRWKLYDTLPRLLSSLNSGRSSRLKASELLVSDNRSVFTSAEFKDFVKTNGIWHTTSAPYQPSTNGLAPNLQGKKAPDAPLREITYLSFCFNTESRRTPQQASLHLSYYWIVDLALSSTYYPEPDSESSRKTAKAEDWSWSACGCSEVPCWRQCLCLWSSLQEGLGSRHNWKYSCPSVFQHYSDDSSSTRRSSWKCSNVYRVKSR